jgi:archaellum component FlaC
VAACIGFTIWDTYSTYKELDRLSKEIDEIKKKIDELSSNCPLSDTDKLKRIEKIEELEKQAYEKALERTRALGKGVAVGVPIVILCGAAPFLPF